MKRALVIFYLLFFIVLHAASSLDDIWGNEPLWYVLLDFVIPGLTTLSVALYAINVKPKGCKWFWVVVPVLYVILLLWDTFRLGVYLTPRPLVIAWSFLLPAIYLSFRFGFSTLRSPAVESASRYREGNILVGWKEFSQFRLGKLLIFLFIFAIPGFVFSWELFSHHTCLSLNFSHIFPLAFFIFFFLQPDRFLMLSLGAFRYCGGHPKTALIIFFILYTIVTAYWAYLSSMLYSCFKKRK